MTRAAGKPGYGIGLWWALAVLLVLVIVAVIIALA